MQEIQELITKRIAEMNLNGLIEEQIVKGVEKAVTEVISDQFTPYGNFTKQLEELVKEQLHVNSDDLDLASYNQQMLSAVKTKIADVYSGEMQEKMNKELGELLGDAPKEMPLADLLTQIAGIWRETEDSGYLDSEMTVEIKPGTGALRESVSVDIWKKQKTSFGSNRSADIQLYISDGAIRISHRQGFNPTCMDQAEALIFKLYARGTKITEIEECDIYDLDLSLRSEHEWD